MKFAGEVGFVCSSVFVDAMKGLLRYDQLEAWQRDNPLITSGYRPLFRSYLGCVRSIAGWHNESVNIVSAATALRG